MADSQKIGSLRNASGTFGQRGSDDESSIADSVFSARRRESSLFACHNSFRKLGFFRSFVLRWPFHLSAAFVVLIGSAIAAGIAWNEWSDLERQGMQDEANHQTAMALAAVIDSLQQFIGKVQIVSSLMATRSWKNLDYIEVNNMLQSIVSNPWASGTRMRCGLSQMIPASDRVEFERSHSFKMGRNWTLHDHSLGGSPPYDNFTREVLYLSSCQPLSDGSPDPGCWSGRPVVLTSAKTVKKEIDRVILRGEPAISLPRSSPVGGEVVSVYSLSYKDLRADQLSAALQMPLASNQVPRTVELRQQLHASSVGCLFDPQLFFDATASTQFASSSLDIVLEMSREDSENPKIAYKSKNLGDSQSIDSSAPWAASLSSTIHSTKFTVTGYLSSSAREREKFAWKTPAVVAIAVLPFVLALLVVASLIQSQMREDLNLAVAHSKRQSLRRFLSCTSHDLRTPLQAIISIFGLFKSDFEQKRLPEDAEELLKLGNGSAQVMHLILSNVLDYDKIEHSSTGQLELDDQPCDLLHELRRLTDVIRYSSLNKSDKVQIEFKGQEGAAACVNCDLARVLRVALNLLSNAIKFTDTGRVSISVRQFNNPPKWLSQRREQSEKSVSQSFDDDDESLSCTPVSDEPEGLYDKAIIGSQAANDQVWIQISVRDSGRGMPSDFVKVATQPYKCSSHDQGGGSGLGLFICDSVARSYGGGVLVQSALGKGTRVSVALHLNVVSPQTPSSTQGTKQNPHPPIPEANIESEISPSANLAHESNAGKPETTAISESADSDATGGQVVAFIEDNSTIRRLAERALKKIPQVKSVFLANDGTEGLDLLKSHPEISLVFSDINMPYMNGDQMVREFRAWEQENKLARKLVVAITGNAGAEDREAYLCAGFDELMAKPISQDKFVRFIERVEGLKTASSAAVV